MADTATVASIALYGSSSCGHDTITRLAGGEMIGAGEPVAGRSGTDALWLALDDVEQRVPRPTGRARKPALVSVHIDTDTGPKVAYVRLHERRPYFGDLEWHDAPVVTLSASAIVAAAEPERSPVELRAAILRGIAFGPLPGEPEDPFAGFGR